MHRTHSKHQLPASKPRNPVMRVLARLGSRGAGRHVQTQEKRRADLDRLDLDARVREVGEW